MWFFGTYEMGCIKRGDLEGFQPGLEQELHLKCKRSVKTFRLALYEAYVYLRVRPSPLAWKTIPAPFLSQYLGSTLVKSGRN